MTAIHYAAQYPTAAQQYDFFAAMIDAMGLENRNMTKLVMAMGGQLTGETQALDFAKAYMTKLVFAEAQASQAADFQKAYQEKQTPPMKLRILLSYHYYKDTDLDDLLEKKFAPHYPEIFIDSGGFSAMTQGVQINFAEYCAFLKRFKHRITTYANLDTIGNAEATWANQQRMHDAGLNPIPVFHTDEPFEYLERYVDRYPYIALGGMVPYMRQWKTIMPWIIRCFKVAKNKSVFHGFGCTTWNIISRVPWYSVDSSSWAASFRFGNIGLFNSKSGSWQTANLGDAKTCKAAESLFREYGFDWKDFADRKRNDRKKIAGISALAYIKAEAYLRRIHGEVKMPHREDIGTWLCLADKNAQHDLVHVNNTINAGARVYLADPALDGSAKDTRMALGELVKRDGGGQSVPS